MQKFFLTLIADNGDFFTSDLLEISEQQYECFLDFVGEAKIEQLKNRIVELKTRSPVFQA